MLFQAAPDATFKNCAENECTNFKTKFDYSQTSQEYVYCCCYDDDDDCNAAAAAGGGGGGGASVGGDVVICFYFDFFFAGVWWKRYRWAINPTAWNW